MALVGEEWLRGNGLVFLEISGRHWVRVFARGGLCMPEERVWRGGIWGGRCMRGLRAMGRSEWKKSLAGVVVVVVVVDPRGGIPIATASS